jgi:solute carrier family 35, member E1
MLHSQLTRCVGCSYSGEVTSALVCIVIGVLVAAQQEVTFSWVGTGCAMASNLGMVLRGLYSRRCLQGFEGMDVINLFGLISISSLIFCIPISLVLESHAWPQAASAAAAVLGSEVALLQVLFAGGLFYHLYNQLSYMVLYQGISPVTFSVGNTMKRVAIIVTSVAFFKNPVTLIGWAGSAAAVFGTYWYSAATWRVRQQFAR